MNEISPERPYFSIVLPTYQVEKYIDRCIGSCVDQTFGDFEVIVVDDRGMDSSIEKASNWKHKDQRIKIVTNPRNLGTYHARRVGVEHATGHYILFLDPDDTLEPQALEILHNKTAPNRPDLLLFGVSTSPYRKRKKLVLPQDAQSNNEVLKNCFLSSAFFNFGTPGKVYARHIIQSAFHIVNVNPNDKLVLGEDALLFFAATTLASKSASVHHDLYVYYQHPDSITNKKDANSVLIKSKYLYRSISYLYTLLASEACNSMIAEKCGKRVIDSLRFDLARMRRHLAHEIGKGVYLECIIEMLKLQTRPAEIIRIVAYFFSAGMVRL